jgi:hypothetical protein
MTTHKQTDESMYILNYNVFELPIELKKISAISIIIHLLIIIYEQFMFLKLKSMYVSYLTKHSLNTLRALFLDNMLL